jgi:integrase
MPGCYQVEHRPNGYKGKLERVVVDSIEKAISLDMDLKEHKGRGAKTLHPKFKDVVEEYLIWVKREQSESTLHNKITRLERYVIPYFGDYRAKDLSQVILDRYAAQHTRNIYRVDLAHLMALVKWMQKRKLAPLLDFKPESMQMQPQIKTIPAVADLLKVLTAIENEQHRMLFTLILFCGLRWSEAAKLRWENVDLNAGVIRIAEVEADKKDVVPIPEPVREWLKMNRQIGGWIFPGRKKGQHIKRLDYVLNDAAKTVGIKLNPHLLRHASATLLYEATGDIYAVQHHLRHSKVATSQIYTRFSVVQKAKSMGKLIEHMFNSKKSAKPHKQAV